MAKKQPLEENIDKVVSFFHELTQQRGTNRIDDLRVIDIAKGAGVAPATMLAVMEVLEQSGVLDRIQHHTNSRRIRNVYVYHPQDEGAKKYRKLHALRMQAVQALRENSIVLHMQTDEMNRTRLLLIDTEDMTALDYSTGEPYLLEPGSGLYHHILNLRGGTTE